MVQCQICGKGVMRGHNVRHTHTGQWMKRASKTPKIFMPNIQKGRVLVDGLVKNVKACASCLAQYKIKYVAKTV